jgi:hypothetical protein
MKKKTVVPRISQKQRLAEFKNEAIAYIQKLRAPNSQLAFSITAYNVTANVKKPNALSAPELLAIVCTARQLGKDVNISVSGTGDMSQLDFRFVDRSPSIPLTLF